MSKLLVVLSLLGGIGSLESTSAGAEVAALEFASLSPAPGTSFLQGAPTVLWSMTAPPGLGAVTVAIAGTPSLSSDGRTLAEAGDDGAIEMRPARSPGLYRSTTGVPRRLTPGTYYWQMQAQATLPSGEYQTSESQIYSFVVLPRHGPEGPPDQNDGLEGTEPFDTGVYIAYCARPGAPYGRKARAAGTSEAGWPAKECLKMDKGPAGRPHTLVGLNGVHNWLLGGYGNDTIIGGNHGDVIWADYHPSGAPRSQTATIHAGNGRNVIYANDTHNYVWTGTNPNTVVHAHASGISGTIHCQASGIIVFLSTVSERYFKLDGCHHISHYSVGY